jgi:glycine hydroxymethyltransferase
MDEQAGFILDNVKKHHELFSNSLPMIASENIISPLARQMLIADFCCRSAPGDPKNRLYQGNEFVDEVELMTQELAKELFKAPYVDVRPISGAVANLGVLMALAKPGDNVTMVEVSEGGRVSSAKSGCVGVRGCNLIPYPWDEDSMNIDVDASIKMLRHVKPKIALFGQSLFLFPTPLKELRDALVENVEFIWYDGAYVLGLIAGGKFQDPLREGVEIMTGSTHKTLPGPQHGIILANPKADQTEHELGRGVFPGVVSNHHLHAMAALGITLAEHISFGKDYADQVVRNAKALGQALNERGFKVLCPNLGFTESHIVAVDVSDHGGGKDVVEKLERANIIANKNTLPQDTGDDPQRPSGMRLGTQELTRLGMKEGNMGEVAELIKRVVVNREDPKLVKESVIQMRKDFNTIHYCFTEGAEAHRYYEIV